MQEPTAPTGDGTAQSPFRISNKSELLWFAEKVNKQNATYGNAHAVLTADIIVNEGDVAGYDGVTSKNKVWDTWTPIGNQNAPFTGTFDGGCHKISGLFSRLSYQVNVGLFGVVGEGGVVKNVGIENSWLSGYDNIGAVCGKNEGDILNCYNTSTIVTYIDGAYIGGVCGNNAGTVSGCFNVGEMFLFNDEVTDQEHGDIDWYLTGQYSVFNGKTYTGVLDARSSGSALYCYYLSDATTLDGGRTQKQFRLGEVAYWVSQNEGGHVWGQNLDYFSGEFYPVFNSNKVYASGTNSDCIAYSNTPISETYTHNY